MPDVTQLLEAIDTGDSKAADQLLPLVYDELRRLAAQRMAHERSGQTLQPTALVHEAWLRLAGDPSPRFEGRGHFFAAAAEATPRILIDRARQRKTLKRGGSLARETRDESKVGGEAEPEEILAVDGGLTKLGEEDPELAKIVKLRNFIGMTIPEIAAALGVSPSTVDR